MKGWKSEKAEERKDGKMAGSAEVQKSERADGRAKGRKHGWKDRKDKMMKLRYLGASCGRTQTDKTGKRDGQKAERAEGRRGGKTKGQKDEMVLSRNIHVEGHGRT